MSSRKRNGRLEVEEHFEHQRTGWLVERIGWVGMAVIIVLGLAGVFGRGPVSWAAVSPPDARFAFRYERFTRHGSPTQLHVEFDHARAEDDTLARVWFDREYLDGLQLQSITPEPVDSESDGDRVTYSFRRADTSERAVVVFDVITDRIGRNAGIVGVPDAAGVAFRQLVFP